MPELKAIQKWILKYILENIEVHDAAHGFRRNKIGSQSIARISNKI